MALKKSFLAFIFVTLSIFTGCRSTKKNMSFSFEQIQKRYNSETANFKTAGLCPFYIYEKRMNKLEQQLNESIKESDYCSILIYINIDGGKYGAHALYNNKKDVYLDSWNLNDIQALDKKDHQKVPDPNAIKILKKKPRSEMIIETPELPILDATSVYIIKKIKQKTYYYAYYAQPETTEYKQLIELF